MVDFEDLQESNLRGERKKSWSGWETSHSRLSWNHFGILVTIAVVVRAAPAELVQPQTNVLLCYNYAVAYN